MGLWGFDQIISGSVAQKEDLAECAHCGTKIKRVDNIIAGADGETWKIRAAPDYDKSSIGSWRLPNIAHGTASDRDQLSRNRW